KIVNKLYTIIIQLPRRCSSWLTWIQVRKFTPEVKNTKNKENLHQNLQSVDSTSLEPFSLASAATRTELEPIALQESLKNSKTPKIRGKSSKQEEKGRNGFK